MDYSDTIIVAAKAEVPARRFMGRGRRVDRTGRAGRDISLKPLVAS